MAVLDSVNRCARDCTSHLKLHCRQNGGVARRDENRGGDIDFRKPAPCAVQADFDAGFEDHAEIVFSKLRPRPGRGAFRSARGRVREQGFPQLSGYVGTRLGESRRAGEGAERGTEGDSGGDGGQKTRTRGAENEARNEFGILFPQQLGYGTPHRIADGDDRSGAQAAEQVCRIVCAVLQSEGLPTSKAPAVASKIGRNHSEGSGERLKGLEPIESRGGHPAMEEQYRWGRFRPPDFAVVGDIA